MSNTKWVFFDLDGTLVDNIPSLYIAYLDFLNDYGIKGTRKEFNSINGPSLKEIVKILKNKYKIKKSIKSLHDNYLTKIKYAYKKTRPKKQSKCLLDNLIKKGYKLALVTSSPTGLGRFLVKRYEWGQYFNKYVFGDEVTRSKPHPDIYKLCLKKTKAKLEQTIVIEDSKNGFESAAKAGLRCILLDKKMSLSNIMRVLNDYG